MRVLSAAYTLFSDRGIDAVTIAEIAEKAGVAGSTVYAAFKSKDGILRALMERSLFGSAFQAAARAFAGVTDPVRALEMTATVARSIYESESRELGLLRNTSGFSPALRQMEQEFEALRYRMQEGRIVALFDAKQTKPGLALEEARRIAWMYTSRDVYRMLVHEGGWTPERYEQWLRETLLNALVKQPRG
ncbi:MAG: TetR/AcrR family transcriptional regulator [Telluria sp.]